MIGKTILHYKILEKLGEGGMGIVYLAEDMKLERKVAIKFLPHHISANPEEIERFKIEARTAASLNHPNIATIYTIEEANNEMFIVMEYIDGKELKVLIEQHAGAENTQPLQMNDVINYAVQIAEGLMAAHNKGIIHRDIKSSNIMLTNDGKIKIMDFGLAKVGKGAQLTQIGTAIGTIEYMSPEQTRGEKIDRRTDIWSFGVVLYEMLTGRIPFAGDYEQAIIYSILNTEPFYPPDLISAFKNILVKMLNKKPERRYDNLQEFLNEIKSIDPSVKEENINKNQFPSIAVLPFSDLSQDRNNEYFCEGIAEEILNAVSKIEGLKISSRTSSFQLKNTNYDIYEIGQKLKVDSVLEGSVRKAGERIRINVQLINTEDGFQLWSDRYDRKLEDVFEVQDDIAANVVSSLKGIFTKDEKEKIKIPETNIRAYEHFLKGRYEFYQLKLDQSKASFEEAVKQDPAYAPAFAYLAFVHSWKYEWLGRNENDLKEAVKYSKKALELAENLTESHTARAFVLTLEGNYKEAEDEFMRAIEIDPNSYDAYYLLARMCFSIGKTAEAADYFHKASEIRKEDFQSISLLSLAYRVLGNEEEFKKANREAINRESRNLELDPSNDRAFSLGAIDLLNAGEKEKAFKWQDKALELKPEEPSVLINAACFYARVGMQNKALEFLEKFVNKGYGSRSWIEHDPDYDSIRDHPRFKELLLRLK